MIPGRTTSLIVRTIALLLCSCSISYGGDEAAPLIVHPVWAIPFCLLLLSFALFPFINKHWWEKRYPVVSFSLAGIVISYYLFGLDGGSRMLHAGYEYLSFIILIGSLFVVSGGIHIRMKGKSTPLTNVVFLGLGAIMTNFIGTTGASMILIRPFLRVNKYRLKAFHVVFFIFIVSNMGGALTPIGDPPLFLGYLRGVPFFWILQNVWHVWMIAIGAILFIFFLFDLVSLKKYESSHHIPDDSEFHEHAEVSGLHNIIFLSVIILAVFIQTPFMMRELLMVVAAVGSYVLTSKNIHVKNDFNFVPIKEVTILFFGIFATMVPALDWLERNASQIGISSPGHFYWGTGILSSVLDNAPTYLTFLTASIGLFVNQDIVTQVQHLVSTHGSDIANISGQHVEEIRNTFGALLKFHPDLVASGNVPLDDINISYLIGNHNIYLKSISISAVFFGACTYIGNGPNFMVKSIAQHAGAAVPNFLEYIWRYVLPILLPILIVIGILFFN